MKYFVHSYDEFGPYVTLLNGMNYLSRIRWATDPGLLLEPPVGTRDYDNYSVTPSVTVLTVNQATPPVLPIDVKFWRTVRQANRNIFCVVEWCKMDAGGQPAGPWQATDNHVFVVIHDPIAKTANVQMVQLTSLNSVTQDVRLDASASTDVDLNATVNPDPGPLEFRWSSVIIPEGVDLSAPVFAHATQLPPTAKPVFLPAGTKLADQDMGLYTFSVEVRSHDTATVGPDTGLGGRNSNTSNVLITPPGLVAVYTDAFIPAARIVNLDRLLPYAYLGGDNRQNADGTAQFAKYKSARMWAQAILGLNLADPFIASAHDCGESIGLDTDGLTVARGKAKTWGMSEGVWRQYQKQKVKDQWVILQISGKAAIPFDTLAPPIIYDYTFWFQYKPGFVTFGLSGMHTLFPAHEIWVGDILVYSYDPVHTTPLSLLRTTTFGVPTTTIPLAEAAGDIVWRDGDPICYFRNFQAPK